MACAARLLHEEAFASLPVVVVLDLGVVVVLDLGVVVVDFFEVVVMIVVGVFVEVTDLTEVVALFLTLGETVTVTVTWPA